MQNDPDAEVKVVKATEPQSTKQKATSYAQHAKSLASTGLVSRKTKAGGGDIPPKPGNEARSKWRAIVNTPVQQMSNATKKKILGIAQERPPQKFHRLHIEISAVPNESVADARRRMGMFLKVSGLRKHIRTFSNIGKRILEIYFCDAVEHHVERIIRENQLRVKRDLNPAAFESLDRKKSDGPSTGHTQFENLTGHTLEKRREQVAKRLGSLLATQTLVEMRKCIEKGFDSDLLAKARTVAKEIQGQQLDRWYQLYDPKAAAPMDGVKGTVDDETTWYVVDRKGNRSAVEKPHASDSMDVEESAAGQQ
jgi:hypothetical protein